MAEPTTSTAVAATAAAGVGLATLIPWIDVNALIGAIFGAAVVAMTKKELRPAARLLGMLLSIIGGYISAPEILNQTPITQTGPAAAVGAVLIIPVLLKALAQVEKLDLGTLLKGSKGG
ncbi:putative holin [Perlucidibaca piscinae]|uniref:putative holin n=1 Tax=Perlucidibaca piscinae TaxID=392589 RepID=UPI0003B636F7|nr:putative holin [Perlucidibaca piscinae]